ncbi:hypothetical protein BJV82DRAFT_712107 [Fennellomyces sp. T-0311]|nr:hypothetical protein BJV82DRAFT_712107 [Fennellomyces sp. T-0311]
MLVTCRSAFIKAKWISFLMWFTADHHSSRKKTSSSTTAAYYCSFCSNHEEEQSPPPPPQYFQKRRTSRCSNTSEFSSSSPPATQFMALFRRRASNASEVSNVELKKETQNVYRLYALAVDELNFAEDSRGSPYYAGDLVTAREAIDECAGAFMRLLQQIPDHSMRTQLQAAITPRLLNLQEKFNALPPESSLLSL